VSWQNYLCSWLLRKKTKPLFGKPMVTVHDLRAHTAESSRSVKPPRGWRVRETSTPSHPVCGERIEPKHPTQRDAPQRVILYLHGGGYCFCSPGTHRSIAGALAKEAETRVFSLDYRLAPEHPFPAAVDDALAAYLHLLADGTPASADGTPAS
jgi:epsilon-lactone hydrolase